MAIIKGDVTTLKMAEAIVTGLTKRYNVKMTEQHKKDFMENISDEIKETGSSDSREITRDFKSFYKIKEMGDGKAGKFGSPGGPAGLDKGTADKPAAFKGAMGIEGDKVASGKFGSPGGPAGTDGSVANKPATYKGAMGIEKAGVGDLTSGNLKEAKTLLEDTLKVVNELLEKGGADREGSKELADVAYSAMKKAQKAKKGGKGNEVRGMKHKPNFRNAD